MRYEIKARSISEILDGAFQLYRNHFVTFWQIAVTIAVPMFLLQTATVWGITGRLSMAGLNPTQIAPNMNPTRMMLALGLALPFTLVSYALQQAALASAVGDTYLGRPVNPWARVMAALPTILGASALVGLGVGLGWLCLVVPGILLGLRWSFTIQAVMLEGRGASAAMARSRQLMAGRRGKVAALYTVVGILVSILVVGVSAFLPASLKAIPLLTEILQTVLGSLVAPLTPCVITLAYFDARVEKEAFDLEVLASNTSQLAPAAPRPVAPHA